MSAVRREGEKQQISRGRRMYRALPVLLLALTVLPILLLVYARREDARAGVQFADVNTGGSVRMRSLWLYGAGQPDAHVSLSARIAQRNQMRVILNDLRERYPADVAATDTAWARFDTNFQQRGQVGWQNAVAMRDAADILTRHIEGLARRQAWGAARLLFWGTFALGLSGLGSLILLRRLRHSEETQERLTCILDTTTDLVAMSDPQGLVTYGNSAFRRFMGLSPNGALPRIISLDTHAPWSQEKMRTEGRPTALANGVWEGETALIHPTRGAVPMSQLVLAHHAPDGSLDGFSTVARDISERKRVEAALQETEALFRSAISAMQEGFLVQDTDGSILMANECAEEILGLAREDTSGQWSMRPNWSVVYEDGTPFARTDHPSRQTLRTGQLCCNITMGVDQPGQPRQWLLVNAAPLYHMGDVKPYAAVTTFSDITAQKAAADDLHQAQERLRTVVGNAPMILFSLDTQGVFTTLEGRGLEMMGAVSEEGIGQSLFEVVEHDPVVCTHIRRVLAGEEVSYISHIHGHTWDNQCRPLVGADGVEGVIGVAFDVTDRHQAEAGRRRGEERLRRLYEVTADADLSFEQKTDRLLQMGCTEFGLDVGILSKMDDTHFEVAQSWASTGPDMNGLTCHPCQTFCQTAIALGEPLDIENVGGSAWATHPAYLAHKMEAYLGTQVKVGDQPFGSLCFIGSQPHATIFTPADKDLLRLMAQWVGSEMQRRENEQQMRDYNIVLEFQKQEMERANSDLAQANAQLATLAATDSLTGLCNRRALNERLTEEVSRARRYDCPLSLILIDVDHFKQYNDTFGHPAGDFVLQTVGQMLHAQARVNDIAARYGGEEFAVLLPETDAIGASVVAERIRHALERYAWPLRGITVSVGTCTLSASTANAETLLAEADAALYRSKAAGRNCVTHAGTSQALSKEKLGQQAV